MTKHKQMAADVHTVEPTTVKAVQVNGQSVLISGGPSPKGGTVGNTTTYGTTAYSNWKEKKCHVATEVFPGLVCGHEYISDKIAAMCDVLVPLHDLDGYVWKFKGKDGLDWRGEIMYVPITDFGVLPDDIALKYANRIIQLINEGSTVGVFCQGGHGRTGYFASIILGLLGIEDPIEHLRTKYCSHAVESSEQVEHIAKLLNKPELKARHQGYKVGMGGGTTLGFGKPDQPADKVCHFCHFCDAEHDTYQCEKKDRVVGAKETCKEFLYYASDEARELVVAKNKAATKDLMKKYGLVKGSTLKDIPHIDEEDEDPFVEEVVGG